MSNLSSSNTLVEYLVKIGGTTVPAAQILDLTLERSLDSVISYGSISFLDAQGIYSSLPIDKDTQISLYLSDHFNWNFNNSEYKIIEIAQNKSDKANGTIVSLYFVDKLYFNASQAYVSKGFKESSIYDITQALIDEIDTGLYKFDVGSKDTFKWETITIPKHKSILQNIKKLANDRGLFLFRTKLNLQLKHITELTSGSVEENLKFTDTTLERDLTKIISKESKNANLISNLVDVPEAKSFKYDIETKSVIPEDIKKADIHADFKIESKLTVVVNEKENQEKFIYNNNNDEESIKTTYGTDLLDNVSMTILVNGTWTADVGKLVEISIFDTNIDKPDDEFKPLAGKYLIHTCIDKIQMGHFTQKLTIIRADEKE